MTLEKVRIREDVGQRKPEWKDKRHKRVHVRGRAVEERFDAYTEDMLSAMHAGFQADARRYIEAQRARGLKRSTMTNSAYNVKWLAQRNRGKTFRDLTPDDLARDLHQHSQGRSATSVHNHATIIKAFLRWCYDDELPPALRRALKRKTPPKAERRPITQEEFEKLLAEADESRNEMYRIRSRALLWILWDSGMRVSEILALRRESVVHEDGGASLVLPPDAERLKTGPRTVFVIDCVPHLDEWMRIAPLRHPNAPLFGAVQTPSRPMLTHTTTNTLKRLSKRGGVRHVHAHLFRHTRATRAAESGWNEFEMNAYFGWQPGSAMASHYVHMNRLHLKDKVQREYAQTRAPTPGPPPSPAPQTAAISSDRIALLLEELLTELKARRMARAP